MSGYAPIFTPFIILTSLILLICLILRSTFLEALSGAVRLSRTVTPRACAEGLAAGPASWWCSAWDTISVPVEGASADPGPVDGRASPLWSSENSWWPRRCQSYGQGVLVEARAPWRAPRRADPAGSARIDALVHRRCRSRGGHWRGSRVGHDQAVKRRVRPPVWTSKFTGFRSPPKVIVLAVRCTSGTPCPTGPWKSCSPNEHRGRSHHVSRKIRRFTRCC